VFTKSFLISQFSHKSVNVSFVITYMKNRLTNLCGDRLLHSDFVKTFCETSSQRKICPREEGHKFILEHICVFKNNLETSKPRNLEAPRLDKPSQIRSSLMRVLRGRSLFDWSKRPSRSNLISKRLNNNYQRSRQIASFMKNAAAAHRARRAYTP